MKLLGIAIGLMMLVGCGIEREPGAGDPDAVFAHPEGYVDSHAVAAEGGAESCGECHGLRTGDLVLGVVPAAPACRSCHDLYPHPKSMAAGAVHGAAWYQRVWDCRACHGEDGSRPAGGTARGQCTACHSVYPHAYGWDSMEAHGAAVRARSSSACTGCHGADGEAISGSTCSGCHLALHPPGFADPAVHGAVWEAQPNDCAPCHEAEDGVDGRLQCVSCHDLFPHPTGWAAAHAAIAQRRGDGACLTCHDGGLEGPALPVLCGAGCHDGGSP